MRRWPPSLERVGLIISDMGRREEGRYVAQAGAILLKAALQAGCEELFTPLPDTQREMTRKIKASGGVGATASPTTLLEWIQTYLPSTTALQNSWILLKNSEVAELAKDWFVLPPNNAIDNRRAGDLDSNIAGGGRVNEFFNTILKFRNMRLALRRLALLVGKRILSP